MMKKITLGIFAHVDAGKTSLSDALLYRTGSVRKLGKVDSGDSFLDTDALEKKRGITIFSHCARFSTEKMSAVILDTPGHVDFAQQAEEVLPVIDYGILVISQADGISSYTRSLWNLLKEYHIPVFIFVNKMDQPGRSKEKVMKDLQTLSDTVVDFTKEEFLEDAAAGSEESLEEYLTTGSIADQTIISLIENRMIFPAFFGSATKLDGIDTFLTGLEKWTTERKLNDKEFGAKVFKISHDEKGERLTWLRITGGELKNKTEILPDEKINQIRLYDGDNFALTQEASVNEICTVTGLKSSYPGQGLGVENDKVANHFKPVLGYTVDLKGNDIQKVLHALNELNDEDPLLNVVWNKESQEINLELMGEIQLEILKQLMLERYGLDIDFSEGKILYKESITGKVEAVGHFEPLRHYSEVHFLMEPNPERGLKFIADCDREVLAKNWQSQIMTALKAKKHIGVLAGYPLTDVKITLISGRASQVHTVGGDFREATSRGVRDGLMELKRAGKCVLLEPWYDFTLTLKQEYLGRAMTDIQRMKGNFSDPVSKNGYVTLKGHASVRLLSGYASKVRSYTKGDGNLELLVGKYHEVDHVEAEKIIAQQNYDPESDLENTPNSVFCSHGAGHTVVWQDVPQYAQVAYQYNNQDLLNK